jgi:hypothetical protein
MRIRRHAASRRIRGRPHTARPKRCPRPGNVVRVFLAAILIAAAIGGCLGGPEPTAPSPSPGRPVIPVEGEDPWRPGVPAPGRGSFVNTGIEGLWVIQSGSCGCLTADRLIAYYRDGSVLGAEYRVQGNSLTYSNASQPYSSTLRQLFERSNPFGTHDYGDAEGQGDRGVLVDRVWTGTLAQRDQEGVSGYLSQRVRDLRDLPMGETRDCPCAGIRIETLGSPWQSRADAATASDMDDRWQAVAAQMDTLEAWVREP